MESYLALGLTIIVSIPIGLTGFVILADWFFEQTARSIGDLEKLGRPEVVFQEYAALIDVLWVKAIEQLGEEARDRQELRYWTKSLQTLRESDRQLFAELRRLKPKRARRVAGLLLSTGLVDFAEQLRQGTPTTLVLKGLKKGNTAIAGAFENFGLIARTSFAWLKSFCETKADLLENLTGELEKAQPAIET
jgi:hypothetical protein